MKKTLFLISIMSISFLASAQQFKPAGAEGAKTLTIAEANALNGTAQPTINGRPYSEYKAEQDALKKQSTVPAAVKTNDIIAITPTDVNKATVAKLPELTVEQWNKINAEKIALAKNWAQRDANENPNIPKQAISEEAIKQQKEQSKMPDVKQPQQATTTAPVAGILNKPVMTGRVQNGIAPVLVSSDASKGLDKSQGIEVKTTEEVKASAAKVEVKVTKE